MQSCELVVTITAIACTIFKSCSEQEVAVMASAFSQLGDTLATMLAQEEACGNKNNEVPNSNNNVDSNGNNNETSKSKNDETCESIKEVE